MVYRLFLYKTPSKFIKLVIFANESTLTLMNELLLHFIWRHRFLPLTPLLTTEGETVEVVDEGLPNPHAGPDFFNAKIRIDGTLWVGNVEIHLLSSDWFKHGHQHNPMYDNTILHVVHKADEEVKRQDGSKIHQLELNCPEEIMRKYEALKNTETYPPCHPIIRQLNPLTIVSWMSRLQIERLERKSTDLLRRLDLCKGDWERVLFITLARNFGFGLNGDTFERWATSFPLQAAGKHRDNALQLCALFLGQSGFLTESFLQESEEMHRRFSDINLEKLQKEYAFLRHKFTLTPMDYHQWKFLRTRPKGFPPVRIIQLALLYYGGKIDFSHLTNVTTLGELQKLLDLKEMKGIYSLSRTAMGLILINTVIPLLFTYGQHKGNDAMKERALSFYEELKAENNYIIRQWKVCGLKVRNAGESQALIQLKKNYCDRKDCLRCRFGQAYLTTNMNP